METIHGKTENSSCEKRPESAVYQCLSIEFIILKDYFKFRKENALKGRQKMNWIFENELDGDKIESLYSSPYNLEELALHSTIKYACQNILLGKQTIEEASFEIGISKDILEE